VSAPQAAAAAAAVLLTAFWAFSACHTWGKGTHAELGWARRLAVGVVLCVVGGCDECWVGWVGGLQGWRLQPGSCVGGWVV
jgi:hypothetical protein